MKNESLRKISKIERDAECIIRKLYAGLVAIMIVAASVSLLIGQPFVNGFVLLTFGILMATLTRKYRQIELNLKAIKLRLKR
jgi:hypothetical protein